MIAVVLPKAAVLWKLTAAQEIVLSGFQQELYAPHERSVAYWFLSHILEQHLDCLESLRSFMPMGVLHSLSDAICETYHLHDRLLRIRRDALPVTVSERPTAHDYRIVCCASTRHSYEHF